MATFCRRCSQAYSVALDDRKMIGARRRHGKSGALVRDSNFQKGFKEQGRISSASNGLEMTKTGSSVAIPVHHPLKKLHQISNHVFYESGSDLR